MNDNANKPPKSAPVKDAEATKPPAEAPSVSPLTTTRPANLPEPRRAASAEVDAFVQRLKAMAPAAGTGRGRLVFAMDATMSREPTWDMALSLQGAMFDAVRDVGGLDVQLVYFRGLSECRASKWVSDAAHLARLMTTVSCQGGKTQIGKVLTHAKSEAASKRVNALVFVGDAMEENVDELSARAGELGLMGVPVFLFQEGSDERVARAFQEIARLTKGAWCRFDAGSAAALKALLTAVAVYAASGHKGLKALSAQPEGSGARLLLTQLKPDGR